MVTTVAIDQMTVDERAVFVRMFPALALTQAMKEIDAESEKEDDNREGAAGNVGASPAGVVKVLGLKTNVPEDSTLQS